MAKNDAHFDHLETRSVDQRETDLFAALSQQVTHAKTNSPYFADVFKDIDTNSINNRDALAKLPVTRKSDLIELQKKAYPFGGLTAVEPGKLKRIFQSPGPIYDPEGYAGNWWRTARALFAAGFRQGDIVHNTFAYHLTPAGSMMETGAAEIGCAVVPAGVGNTELQVRIMADIRPTAYAGTPSFLKILLAKAREMGEDVSSLNKSIVGGEALFPQLRQEIEDQGVNCQQIYATADLGNIAYESTAREGLIVDEGLIIEIVRPGTNDPVPDGDVGEVVATLFGPEYPLIRFGTGDLSAVMSGTSPCGRTNMRLKGWMGRADQTAKVKGMFVHPAQIAEVVRRHLEIKKARLVIDQRDGADVMTLSCEVEDPENIVGSQAALASDIIATIQAVCKLRAEVGFAALGSLPNDGKIIDDIRTID